MKSNRSITVNYLARVEGEGGMTIKMKNDKVTDVKLKIFEPPRFFEAFLKGRHYTEVPDITARICGICPVAYQSSSANAMEQILGINIDGPIRELRRLLYCGEWIESHALHMFMLHAPDFLGYQDALAMAKDHPEVVEMALRLKKIGNHIMEVVGGREIHPINIRIGGFYKTPRKKELSKLLDDLKWGLDASVDAAKFLATLKIPQMEHDYEYVAMRHETEYPIIEGRIVSNRGIDIDIADFAKVFMEEHVEHSTSLHAKVIDRGSYHVGPLARYALNYDRLPEICQSTAKDIGLERNCKNPFKSIIVRGLELIYSYHEAIRIVQDYVEPDHPYIKAEPKAGVGYGCTEAPRGICWHRYEIDEQGLVVAARIVPPTSQNQKSIERDLHQFASENMDMDNEKLTWSCEQVIRNYDPCISCSCHFLKLNIIRE